MSIIEKAVNALGKGGGENRPGAEAQGDSQSESAASTVERAGSEGTAPSERASAATDSYAAAAESNLDDVARESGSSTAHSRALVDKYVKLNFEDLREIGILTPSVPRSAIAEEYRTIKRPLLMNIAGDGNVPPIKHGNLIMVTSALEGDGKTFTSISLAISIAMEQDKTVMFVDADTAKAEAGRILGIPSDTPGLIDVLEDNDIGLSDVILHTNIENLRVLPAGDLHTHANELLASDRMRNLMVEMSELYSDRVLVFDSPPLLLTTEAAVLCSFMGQIVFVVSADMTPQHAVQQAIEHIGEDKMVGMVLNRARRRSNPYYYTYGEVYGYGRDRQHEYDLHGESG
tara:strand:+ start:41591 stop:42625 length:1035 start_codon:yes stop_codon:yes gene_type:complete